MNAYVKGEENNDAFVLGSIALLGLSPTQLLSEANLLAHIKDLRIFFRADFIV